VGTQHERVDEGVAVDEEVGGEREVGVQLAGASVVAGRGVQGGGNEGELEDWVQACRMEEAGCECCGCVW